MYVRNYSYLFQLIENVLIFYPQIMCLASYIYIHIFSQLLCNHSKVCSKRLNHVCLLARIKWVMWVGFGNKKKSEKKWEISQTFEIEVGVIRNNGHQSRCLPYWCYDKEETHRNTLLIMKGKEHTCTIWKCNSSIPLL